MALRTRWLALAAASILLTSLFGLWWWLHPSDEREARALVSEYRNKPRTGLLRLLEDVGLLGEPRARPRKAIVDDLRALGAVAAEAVVDEYREGWGGWGAQRVLQGIGPEAVPVLLEHLGDRDARVRAFSARFLGRPHAIAGEGEFTGDGAPSVDEVLNRLMPQIETRLAAALRDREPLVRTAAAEALARVALPSEGVLLALCGALRDDDPLISEIVADSLSSLLTETEDHRVVYAVSRSLIDCIEDPRQHTRALASRVLTDVIPRVPLAQEDLVPFLTSDISESRLLAAIASCRVERLSGVTIPLLLGGLAHSSPRIRAASAESLQISRARSDEVVSALLGALRDEEELVRFHAVGALADIAVDFRQPSNKVQRKQKVLSALVSASRDRSELVRAAALAALRRAEAN